MLYIRTATGQFSSTYWIAERNRDVDMPVTCGCSVVCLLFIEMVSTLLRKTSRYLVGIYTYVYVAKQETENGFTDCK